MEVANLLSKPRVLVVDPSRETREVLRTALAARQADVWEATRVDQALALARSHQPDVVVFDVELAQASVDAVCAAFDESEKRASLVLLGTVRRAAGKLPPGEFIAKPYHYAPLIRKIERLLDEAQRSSSADPQCPAGPLDRLPPSAR